MRVTQAVAPFALSWLLAAPQLAAQAQANPPQPANAEAPAAPQLATEVRVAPGALQGKILTAGQQQPIAAHSMILVAGGKPLQTVVTAADGTWHTAALLPGAYSLMVRDDLQLDLVVADGAQTKELEILVPQVAQKTPQRLVPQDPKRVPAAPGGAAPRKKEKEGAGTWAVIGVGIGIAFAVPVVAADRDHPPPVSPVQPLHGGPAR
jgi:hypothetical protein